MTSCQPCTRSGDGTYIFEKTNILDHSSEPCPLLFQAHDASDTLPQCNSRSIEWYGSIMNLQYRQRGRYDLASRRVERRSRMRSETRSVTSSTRLTGLASRLWRSIDRGQGLTLKLFLRWTGIGSRISNIRPFPPNSRLETDRIQSGSNSFSRLVRGTRRRPQTLCSEGY